jgi:hypothetical protein
VRARESIASTQEVAKLQTFGLLLLGAILSEDFANIGVTLCQLSGKCSFECHQLLLQSVRASVTLLQLSACTLPEMLER